MSTHNICFYGEVGKIILEVSLDTPPSQVLCISKANKWNQYAKSQSISATKITICSHTFVWTDKMMKTIYSHGIRHMQQGHANVDVMQQNACLVVNQMKVIIVSFFFFF